MAATKKSPSEKTEEPLTTTERVLGMLALDSAQALAVLKSIDASLKAIVAGLPKPQTTQVPTFTAPEKKPE